jgi:hypothetical protein
VRYGGVWRKSRSQEEEEGRRSRRRRRRWLGRWRERTFSLDLK